MNHDYAHCLDYDKKKCPKTCFRANLTEDLNEHSDRYVGMLFTWASFMGTKECKRSEE